MRRVLIVEDAQELGRLLQAALKTLPFPIESVVVPSAEEAMLDARVHSPDLLVTDIRLPGMTGLDLIHKLRDRTPKTRYIVITALADDELRIRARQLGVRAYFQKPMELADFLAAVTAALEVHESEFVPSDSQPKDQNRPPEKPESKPAPSISELLANLRVDLQAQSVILMDDNGRITGQAGDFPDSQMEQRWMPALLAANSTHTRLARMMGGTHSPSLQMFEGQQFDLFLMPVGDFALVLVFGVGKIASQIALVSPKIFEAQQSLLKAFKGLGVHFLENNLTREMVETESRLDMPEAEEPEGLDQLAALLANPNESPRMQDAHAFWQQTDENLDVTSHSMPGAISFEQARQLGLIPDDPETT